MKIVGNGQKDYYDPCVGYGIDPNLIYVRNTSVTKSDDIPDFIKNLVPEVYRANPHTKKYEYTIDPGFVGFCGIIYPFIRVERTLRYGYQPTKTKFFYNADILIKYLKDNEILRKETYFYYELLNNKKTIRKYLDPVVNLDVFFDLGNPTFYCGPDIYSKYPNNDTVFVQNPSLKKVQFYKVFDAFTAFQEISMFLGGVLGQSHPPMVDISDKDMAIKKGFGHKYAFRKMPTKRRK